MNTAALLGALLLCPGPSRAGEARRVVPLKSGGLVKSAPFAPGNRTSLVPPLRLEVNPQVHTSISPAWRSAPPVQLDAPSVVQDPTVETSLARVPFAAQTPVPQGEEGRKRLIETLAETMPDPSGQTRDGAREDFEKRAQLGEEIPRSGRDAVSGSAPGWGAGFLKRFKRVEKVAFTPSLHAPGGYYYHGTSWKDVLAIALGSSGKMTAGVSYYARGASQAEPFGVSRARKQESKAVLLEFEGDLVGPLVEFSGAPAGIFPAYRAKVEVPLSALSDASKQALIAEFDARGEPADRARFLAALGVETAAGTKNDAASLVASLLDAKTLAGIRDNLKERLPVHEGDFSDERIRAFVADSLAPYLAWRAKTLGRGGADAYAASLSPASGEVKALREQIGLLTGYYGESYSDFFRESSAWLKPLEGYLDRLIQTRLASGNRTIRVKSLGAGTGQEPYSIAIVIERALRKAGQDSSRWKVLIEAVDVNAVSLWAAKEGLFPQQVLAQIPESQTLPTAELIERPRPGIVRMNARLRSWITPVFVNLNEPAQHQILSDGPADVVFAKNMLMHLKLLPSQLLAERLLQGDWGRPDAPAFLNIDVLVAELSPPGAREASKKAAALGNVDPVTFRVGFSQAREEVVFFTDKLWHRLTSRSRTPVRDFFRAVAAAWSWLRLGEGLGGLGVYRDLKDYHRKLRENPGHEEALDTELIDFLAREVGGFDLLSDPRPYTYDAKTGRLALNAALLMSGSSLPEAERLGIVAKILARARPVQRPGGAQPAFFHPGLGSGTLLARGITDDGAVLKVVRFEGGDRLVWLAAARYTPFYGLRRE